MENQTRKPKELILRDNSLMMRINSLKTIAKMTILVSMVWMMKSFSNWRTTTPFSHFTMTTSASPEEKYTSRLRSTGNSSNSPKRFQVSLNFSSSLQINLEIRCITPPLKRNKNSADKFSIILSSSRASISHSPPKMDQSRMKLDTELY